MALLRQVSRGGGQAVIARLAEPVSESEAPGLDVGALREQFEQDVWADEQDMLGVAAGAAGVRQSFRLQAVTLGRSL